MTRNSRHPLRVAFRVDASVQIGSGHVMRCLTLADALAAEGSQCLFLCRAHEGHLLDLVAARGHEAVVLPAQDIATTTPASDLPLPAHAHWLGAHWTTDAQASRKALASASIDWLVVDHYALDRNWEQAMRPICRRLMVIDDLADRPHDCDLLLDQNLGRRAEDYSPLLPPGAKTLIGPRYALLRPEFAAHRAESLARRENPQLRNLLVTMGGVDKDNATGAILDVLADCDLPPDLRITVVLGPHSPFLSQVRAQAQGMPRPTSVLVGVSNMARLMTDADLAIGAAGSTSWERCCLGLPTIHLVLAENQKAIADALEQADVAVTVNISSLRSGLCDFFKDRNRLDHILRRSPAASLISDGCGGAHVAKLLWDVKR